MRHFSVELSARSLYLNAGSLELSIERRTGEWPRLWSSQRELGSTEIWLGRLYICASRRRAVERKADEGHPAASAEVIAFRPTRASQGRPGPAASVQCQGHDQPTIVTRLIPSTVGGVVLALSLAACTNPYDPGQRAVGGGLIGAGTGAAIGAVAGGGRAAATGALIGGAVGAVGGAVTTPRPPPPTYYPPPQQAYAPAYPPPSYPPPYPPPPPPYPPPRPYGY